MSRLSREDRQVLLQIARRAITSAILENSIPDFPPFPAALTIAAGAFVTISRGGRLRGCVGQVDNPGALGDTVARSAINAAMHDPRFSPVALEEVASLQIEISVLSSLELIQPDAIVAGVHGLVVARPPLRGLLLPQVAADRKWSSLEFLEETCMKAGLPRDAWHDPETRIFAFTAEIFSEAESKAIPGV